MFDLVKGDVVTHILSHFGQFISPYVVCELTSCDIYYLSLLYYYLSLDSLLNELGIISAALPHVLL